MKTLATLIVSVLLLSGSAWSISRGTRGGSDYGGAAIPPNSTCGTTAIPGGNANCVYYSGQFGTLVDDTLFQLVPSSNSSITSATVTLTNGVQWSDVSLYGPVNCPLLNTDAPCTAATGVDFSLVMNSSTTGLLNFTGLSAANTSNSNPLQAGLTIFFNDPNATAPFAVVSGSAAITPEPGSTGICAAGILALCGFAAWRKTRLVR